MGNHFVSGISHSSIPFVTLMPQIQSEENENEGHRAPAGQCLGFYFILLLVLASSPNFQSRKPRPAVYGNGQMHILSFFALNF